MYDPSRKRQILTLSIAHSPAVFANITAATTDVTYALKGLSGCISRTYTAIEHLIVTPTLTLYDDVHQNDGASLENIKVYVLQAQIVNSQQR